MLEEANSEGARDGLSDLPADDQGDPMHDDGRRRGLNGGLARFPVPHDAVRRIQDMIASGSISPGEKLPPQRELAATLRAGDLGVHRGLARTARYRVCAAG
ncbi:MAG TPA: GntR family transcriptional regulator [Roseiarcus sp.]|nr:GntR family transcriptional regulator [Roseiarcus sp.]